MQIRVAITSPDGDAERSPAFGKPEISIGRIPSNDVVLPDSGVSSNHARVVVTGGALTIVDLDSTNGTFVNDEPVAGPRVLGESDEVQIGDFVLRFALVGAAAEPSPRVEAPTSLASEWPEEPPMMDELEAGPLPAASHPPARPVRKVSAPPQPASEPPRPAVFPRFEARPAAAAPASAPGFEFPVADPRRSIDRIFSAVWLRVADAVLSDTAGARQAAASLLDEALEAAGAPLATQRQALHARMLEEMAGDDPLRAIVEGEPDEVLVCGTSRIRVVRAGHVSEGPSSLSCPSALRCLVSRCLGRHYDAGIPAVRGTWGEWTLEAMWGAGPGAEVIVSLRRSVLRGTATLEGLVQGGVLAPSMATLLATAALARYRILVCAAPGASARPLLAALLGCATGQELPVVVTDRGVDLGAFRPGTVAVARSDRHDAVDAALALAPDRLAIDDLRWDEARGAMGVLSRSVSVVLCLRAPDPHTGLAQLGDLLRSTVGGAPPGCAAWPMVDLIVGVERFADGVSRVTHLAEPVPHETGLAARDVFTLVPGSRTWQFAGTVPRCHDDLIRRGFRLDPAIFT